MTKRTQDFRQMNAAELSSFWQVDLPWRGTSVLDAAYARSGKYIYTKALSVETALLGLRKVQYDIEGFSMTWLENHKPLKGKPTLLFIHGLSADKSNWLSLAKFFVKDYNVLIIDLPAHGESGYLADQSYHMNSQARRVFKLLDYLNLKKVHVIGHSMGGFVASKMAIASPTRLSSLTLMGAAGITPRKLSRLEELMEKGENPFFCHCEADFKHFMNFVAYQPLWMPRPIQMLLAKRNYARRHRVLHCFADMLDEVFNRKTITTFLPDLKMPILAIWGQEDNCIHVDVMHHIAELAPHAKTIALEKAGHMVMMEKPKVTAQHLQHFLASIEN